MELDDFVTRLGLGACLADDMGLGKTVQVIALLLDEQRERKAWRAPKSKATPSLLVVPASLIANWKSEIGRFAVPEDRDRASVGKAGRQVRNRCCG